MYIKDLDPYCYFNKNAPWDGVLAVGWLENGHDFAQRETSEAFKVKLRSIRRRESVNVCRGYHHCHFCYRQGIAKTIAEPIRNVSHCEVWVPRGQIIYAAPELVCHYIEAHHYLPPAEFIDAVMEFDLDSKWSGKAIAKARSRPWQA